MDVSEEAGEREQKPTKEGVRDRSNRKDDQVDTMIWEECFREQRLIEYGMRDFDPKTGRPYEHNEFQETVETNLLLHGYFYNHDNIYRRSLLTLLIQLLRR
jgi:hypothetical protein